MSKKGYKQTKEHKEKIRKHHLSLGIKHWSHRPEVKAKLLKTLRSDNWLGKKRNDLVYLEKIRVAHLGQKSWNKGMKGKYHINRSDEGTKSFRQKMCGEKHPNWKGGKSFEPYSLNWTKTLKRSIRERDRYTCKLCGELQKDIAFSVHHIDYNKKNCCPENLITLCRKCHTKTNFNRNYWIRCFND